MLRPVVELAITKARKGDLHNRREVLKTIDDKSVVHTLFTEIGPGFAERPGGYTRITKIGPRKGDNAPMAVIELLTGAYTPSEPKAKTRTAEPAAAPAVEVEQPAQDAPAEVLATDASGETQVVETEAADVETAEAQSEAPAPTARAGSRAGGRRQGLIQLTNAETSHLKFQMRRLGVGGGGWGVGRWLRSSRSIRPTTSTVGPSKKITARVPGPMVAPSSQPTSAPRPWTAL